MKTSIFSLIISILVAALGVFQYEKYQKLSTDLHQELETFSQKTDTQLSALQQRIENIEKIEKTLQQKDNTSNLIFSEVEYLVRLAALKINERDLQTAILLLTTANEKIQSLHDPRFSALQEALVSDREMLRMIKLPDQENLWGRVKALAKEAITLPTRGVRETPSNQQPETSKPTPSTPLSVSTRAYWKQKLLDSFQEIKDLVKIRHHEKPIEPLLSSYDETLVKQRLQLLFEETSFAILNLQPTIYKETLKETQEWLNHYFEENNDHVKHIQSEIQELTMIDLTPTLPVLTRSLEQLHTARKLQ